MLIPQKSDKIAGKLTKVSQNNLSLEFHRSPSPPFQVGKRAKIQYWDESDRSLWWKSEIINTSFHGRQMEVSILEKGMERRQHPRRHMAIPFSFTVTQANQTRRNNIGRKGTSETINVGLGGVFFKTDLLLQVGNKLELDLRLSPSQHVYASGWVVRSDLISRPTYVNGVIVVRSAYSISVEFQQLDGAERLREYLASEEGDSHPLSENSFIRTATRLKAGLQKLSRNPEGSFIRAAKGLKAGLQKLSKRIHRQGDR